MYLDKTNYKDRYLGHLSYFTEFLTVKKFAVSLTFIEPKWVVLSSYFYETGRLYKEKQRQARGLVKSECVKMSRKDRGFCFVHTCKFVANVKFLYNKIRAERWSVSKLYAYFLIETKIM